MKPASASQPISCAREGAACTALPRRWAACTRSARVAEGPSLSATAHSMRSEPPETSTAQHSRKTRGGSEKSANELFRYT